MSSSARFRGRGRATVSFVTRIYGKEKNRIMANADLSHDGFDGLIEALMQARAHWESEA